MFRLVSFIPRKRNDKTYLGLSLTQNNDKCSKLHLEALLSWLVELWGRRRAATSAVGDGTEPQRDMSGKKESHFCEIRVPFKTRKSPCAE